MEENSITYKKGFKYKLAKTYKIKTELKSYVVADHFITLTLAGTLTIKRGYAWDGPSGPTFDTKSFMRGALIHDVLYQLMRQERLPQECRKYADELLRKICLEDGMSSLRARYTYSAVRLMAKYAADPESKKKDIIAP